MLRRLDADAVVANVEERRAARSGADLESLVNEAGLEDYLRSVLPNEIGTPRDGGYEAVTWSKRRKLRQLAEAFLAAERPRHAEVRFDVASVWLGPTGPDVEIFEDAF